MSILNVTARLAGLARDVAETRAREAARRAARKAAALLVAGVLLVITLVFAAIAVYLALAAELGSVTAALIIAGGALFLALAVLSLSRSKPRTPPAAEQRLEAEVDMLAEEAKRQLRENSPYLVAAAFVSGFLSGKK